MVTKRAIEQLPSLPQVLVQILDAIHSDSADYQGMAEIIRHDTAVATRLIAVANSSYFGRVKRCESIERALLFLGTDAVRTIVITASIKQFFNHFNQRHNQFLKSFWRRSLISANFAQVLATLTSYNAPDEAYLCGLLADVGQLMLLTSDEDEYLSLLESCNGDLELLQAEKKQFASTHCQLSGELVDSWDISGFMADAVRFHHEPAPLMQDAHHLVKIINLASMLSSGEEIDDVALQTADTLFGLNESLTRELRSRISSDVDNMALSLGIDISEGPEAAQQTQDAHRQLGERLGELGELAQVNAGLWQVRSAEGLQSAVQRSLFLTFGITDSLLFVFDQENNRLVSQAGADPDLPSETPQTTQAEPPTADFIVPVETGRSLVSDCMIQGNALSSIIAEPPLSVFDRQLLRYCHTETLVCWPLKAQKNSLGVLVFGADNLQVQQISQRKGLMQTLCREIAGAITANRERFEQLDQQNPASAQHELRIREAVHEASNPLSIIRNYLEMLRIKLGDEHTANEGLGLIREEIDRVGNILIRLRDPEQETTSLTPIAVNDIIEATGQIFRDSVCTTKQLSLELKLDPQMNEIPVNPGHLKQILTNLIKNAVEALSPGGHIIITSEASVSVGGKDFTAISIEDNGPGIADEVKQQLFTPISSTKGEGHSGLGLSIVKKLIDEMQGSIVCRSNGDTGTQFQVLLPKGK